MTNYFGSCQAMLDAGITDPESQAGKDFCTDHCPYPDCILFGTKKYGSWKGRKARIARLHKRGRTPKEIAEILDISISTVYNHLR